jgi:hypothetical protein
MHAKFVGEVEIAHCDIRRRNKLLLKCKPDSCDMSLFNKKPIEKTCIIALAKLAAPLLR